MQTVKLPNGFRPRPYQQSLWNALENGCKRVVAVWHRRAGKDACFLNWTAVASQMRVGNYWYCLPEFSQGRKVVWNAIDANSGLRRIDQAFPPAIREGINEQEMHIRLRNGSTFQVIGSDRIDALVGSQPAGIVFSEWALCNPRAWPLAQPILLENGGWAAFIGTPRGKNHFHNLYKMAKDSPDWHCELKTAADTNVFVPADLETTRREAIATFGQEEAESLFEQEYNCSWEISIQGSYFGKELDRAEKDGRITAVPHDPSLRVVTGFDLGIHDCTSIWFAQVRGQQVCIFDFFETSGEGLEDICRYITAEKRYSYAAHHMPHDIAVRELISGQSRKATLESLGFRPIFAGANIAIQEGIHATRNLLARAVFDETRCRQGLEALRNYHRVYDEANRVYRNTPHHDWSSHAADAMRTLAVNLKDPNRRPKEVVVEGCSNYDPLR